MNRLDRRKKKEEPLRDMGWVKWFGIALAVGAAAVFIIQLIQMSGLT